MSFRNGVFRRLSVVALSLVMAVSVLGALPADALGEPATGADKGLQPSSAETELYTDQYFQTTINVPLNGAIFTLPTSSYLNGSYDGKPYDWYIDWGDGNKVVAVGVSAEDSGIPHVYAADGIYTITITPNGSTEAWLQAFGFSESGIVANSAANKRMVTGVPSALTPQMTRTTDQIVGTAPPPSYEWARTFYWCDSLVLAPIFEGWDGITSVGEGFALRMFAVCSSLASLPDGFILPQSLTFVGDYFAFNMFTNCISLDVLPGGFNLPQDIVTAGNGFADGMFYYCPSLKHLPEGFSFPQGMTTAGDSFAAYMFYYCMWLDNLPAGFNLPQKLTSVGNRFACNMFFSCWSLTSLPEGFNLPPFITTVGDDFAALMLYGAGSSSFQLNDEFCLPPGLPADCPNAFYEAFQLAPTAPMQRRTATSIIGDCAVPADQHRAFNTHFWDLAYIDVNWGGQGLAMPSAGAPGSGDLNGDGYVTMDEVIYAARASMDYISLSPGQLAAIDMDGDRYLTLSDMFMVYTKAIS